MGEVTSYDQVLGEVVAQLASGQARAVAAVGVERIRTYHAVGSVIAAAQREQGWGAQVIDRLSADLRARFPDQTGLGPRNLRYMRDLAVAWPDGDLATAVAKLPWTHVTVLLSQVKDPTVRVWYAEQAIVGRVDGHPHGALDRGGGLAGGDEPAVLHPLVEVVRALPVPTAQKLSSPLALNRQED